MLENTLEIFYIIIKLTKWCVILNITAGARTSNPKRSSIKQYPNYNFAGTPASEIEFVSLLLKGGELNISADFVTDIVALGTVMKGCNPAPHKTTDELIEALLTFAYLSQDLFERTMQVSMGSAIARVCLEYIERDMFTIAEVGGNKKRLIVADYMFYGKEIETSSSSLIFEKKASWPDFLIFHDPNRARGSVITLGFVLTQFAKSISNPPRDLVSPSDFDVVSELTAETKLSDEQIESVMKIVSLMVSKRLFTERKVPSVNNNGSSFRGWYFCKGCFQSYIEKSFSGCKGDVYHGVEGVEVRNCSSIIKRKLPK